MITVLNGDLYQWELGRVVQVRPKEGDKIERVECYHEGDDIALSVPITNENGIITAPIPNILLQQSEILVICAVSIDTHEVRTIELLRVRVRAKAKPTDYIYTETECITVKDFVNAALLDAKERGELAYTCKTYTDYAEMVADISSKDSDVFAEGQDIRILTLDVPDLWVAYVDRDYGEYTYTNDNAIIEALNANGFIKIGYYRLGALETQKVDLLDYVKNTDYASTSTAGIVKVSTNLGTFMDKSGAVGIAQATETNIDNRSSQTKPITPNNLDYAVKTGITTNAIELTEDEKAAVRNWIGAIKEPEANANILRVIVVEKTGEQGTRNVVNGVAEALSIVQRTGGGQIRTKLVPIEDADCTSKKYVDDITGDIESALDELHTYAQSLIGGNA